MQSLHKKFPQVEILALSVLVTVPMFGFTSLVPSLGFIEQDLNGNPGQSVAIINIYLIGYGLSVLLGGYFATFYDIRRLLCVGMFGYSLAAILATVSPSLSTFIIYRFIQGLFGGMSTVLTRIYVKQKLPAARQTAVIALLASATAVATVSAPIIGGILGHNWQILLIIMAVHSAIAFIATMKLNSTLSAAGDNKNGNTLKTVLQQYFTPLKHATFIMITASLSLAAMAQVAFITNIVRFLREQADFSSLSQGISLTIGAIAYTIGATFYSKKLSYLNAKLCLITVFSGVSVLIAIIVVARYVTNLNFAVLLLVAGGIAMVGVGVVIPATQNELLRSKFGNSSQAAGMFFFLQMIGAALFSTIAASVPNQSWLYVISLIFFPMVCGSVVVILSRN